MKIQELIFQKAQVLKRAGIESYILDSRLLLAHVLGASKQYVIMNPTAANPEDGLLLTVIGTTTPVAPGFTDFLPTVNVRSSSADAVRGVTVPVRNIRINNSVITFFISLLRYTVMGSMERLMMLPVVQNTAGVFLNHRNRSHRFRLSLHLLLYRTKIHPDRVRYTLQEEQGL